jgi:glycerol-3-phosphate dehydrogenase
MWDKGWRDQVWSSLDRSWDIIVIGGGITGAGILREASRAGLHTLLVEKHDFASGTSSRSSKLVHGGFRYLQNAQIKLTLESVRERERLLKEGRGLINPLGFLLASYAGDRTPAWVLHIGLILYDLLALKWGHRYYDALDIKDLCPPLTGEGLQGGFRYFDAQTDDARLVLRVIQEAVLEGGTALNYAAVTGLLRRRSGQVCGVVLENNVDAASGHTLEIQAPVIINATGAWADDLRSMVGGRSRLRKLRGSHLVIPARRLPLTRSISFMHPMDSRFVFAFPWEGVTIVGTTDVDYQQAMQTDPSISPGEAEYLLTALKRAFPEQEISFEDIQGTFSGVRSVIGTGKADPSKESREYALWCEDGLLSITGGKLTTFRLMAHDALRRACVQLPGAPTFNPDLRVLNEPPIEDLLQKTSTGLSRSARLRLAGRYGVLATQFLAESKPDELAFIEETPALWADLRWAARYEGVVHLDDLLLRRVRLGLILPMGGLLQLDQIRAITQADLGWDDARWESELSAYRSLLKKSYQIQLA